MGTRSPAYTNICDTTWYFFFFGVNGNLSLEILLYSLLVSAPIVFILGIWMNKKSRHDMWFLPVQYWGIIWAVIAIGILAFKAITK